MSQYGDVTTLSPEQVDNVQAEAARLAREEEEIAEATAKRKWITRGKRCPHGHSHFCHVCLDEMCHEEAQRRKTEPQSRWRYLVPFGSLFQWRSFEVSEKLAQLSANSAGQKGIILDLLTVFGDPVDGQMWGGSWVYRDMVTMLFTHDLAWSGGNPPPVTAKMPDGRPAYVKDRFFGMGAGLLTPSMRGVLTNYVEDLVAYEKQYAAEVKLRFSKGNRLDLVWDASRKEAARRGLRSASNKRAYEKRKKRGGS